MDLNEYLQKIEEDCITEVLNETNRNLDETAKTLGISLRSLKYRLDKIEDWQKRENLSIKENTREIEEHLIKEALEKTGGNEMEAARILQISNRVLLYKMKDYKINM